MTLTAVPSAGYVFDSWSGQTEGIADLHQNPVTFQMGDRADNNRVVTANFSLCASRYTVTTGSEPNGGGSVTLDPEQTPDGYLCNQSVSVLATGQTGYVFSHWSGDLSGAENPKTLLVGDNETITAVFVPAEPGTDFSADKTMALEGQPVQFTDESTGPVTSWQWDFGDGTNDTVQNPSHTYSSAGTYTVSLTTATLLVSRTVTKTNHIAVYPRLQADFLVSSVKSQEGQIIVFFINTSSGGVAPLTYAWDFENDGTADATEREPWHFYSTSGTYTVRLIVTDSAGNAEVKVRPNCLTIFSSDGGTAETADGQVSAEFPSGAVAGTAMVTIRTRTASGLPDVSLPFAIGDTCFLVTALDDSGNEIVSLSQPSVITAKYSEADLAAADGDPNRLVLAYWDEAASEWKPLKTSVDTANMTLSASTGHLSTWAVLVRTTSASNGLPLWSWVLIALGAVGVVGASGYLAFARLAKRQ